jgi:hypothetical protein
MRDKLTLHPIARSRSGPEYGFGPIFHYRVDNMPGDDEAELIITDPLNNNQVGNSEL